MRDIPKKVATLHAVGDCETKIEEVSSNLSSFVLFAESELDYSIPGNSIYEEIVSYLSDINNEPDYDFEDGVLYTVADCKTQFEKIIAMLMILTGLTHA